MNGSQQENHDPHMPSVEQQGVKPGVKSTQRTDGQGEMEQDVRSAAVSADRYPIGVEFDPA